MIADSRERPPNVGREPIRIGHIASTRYEKGWNLHVTIQIYFRLQNEGENVS
jgi:hypothetical protein